MHTLLKCRKTRLIFFVNLIGLLFSALKYNYKALFKFPLWNKLILTLLLGFLFSRTYSEVVIIKVDSPEILSFTPANNSLDIPIGLTTLSISFDSGYKTVNGKTIFVRRYEDDALVTSTTFVSQTFTPSVYSLFVSFTSAAYGKKYYVTFDEGTFTDHSDQPFPGVTSKDDWTFTIVQDPEFETVPPIITSRFPANGSTEVSSTPGLNLTFDEEVTIVSGKDIEIRRYSDDLLVLTLLSFESSSLNTVWLISEAIETTLDLNTKYYITLDAGVFEDKWGNPLAATVDKDEWTFTTIAPDTQAPLLDELAYPENGAIDIGLTPQSFYFSFNEQIRRVDETESTIKLFKNNGDLVETFTSENLEIEGTGVTVNHHLLLEPSTGYYVVMDEDLVEDENGNRYEGFMDSETWNFSTRSLEDEMNYFIYSVTPALGSTDISKDLETISIEFNSPVTIGNGFVYLKSSEDGTILKSWDLATSTEYTVTESVLEFTGITELEYETSYYVEVESVSGGMIPSLFYFEDDGYLFSGWETDFWTFTTESAPDTQAPEIVSIEPGNLSTDVSITPSFTITFNEPIVPNESGSGFPFLRLFIFPDLIEQISLTDSELVQITENQIQVEFSEPLAYETKYLLSIASGMVTDLAGNANEMNPNTEFTTTSPDTQAPQVVSIIPDNSTTIDREVEIYKVVFDEPISIFSSAGLYLREYDSDRDVTQNNLLTFARKSGDTLIIDRSFFGLWDAPKLASGTKYYFYSQSSGIQDELGNSRGFEKGDIVFTTSGEPGQFGPEIGEAYPSVGAQEVPIDSWVFKFIFLDGLINGPAINGSVNIREYDTDQVIASMNAVNRILSGDTILFDFNQFGTFTNDSLAYGTRYYVDIPANNIKDNYGYYLVPDKDQWTFTTEFGPKIEQTITFDEIENKKFGDPTFDLIATSSSNLPVNFEVISGPAELDGNKISITGVGNVVIRATQLGNNEYEAAAPVDRSFAISKATQNITILSIPTKDITDSPFSISAQTTSDLPLIYEILNGPASLNGTTITLSGIVGSVTIKVSQAGNEFYLPSSATKSFQVIDNSKLEQTISIIQLSNKTYGDSPFELQANASSNLSVEWRYVSGPASLTGNTVTILGAGTAIFKAEQGGNDLFNPAPSVELSIEISKAVQNISVLPINQKYTTDEDFSLDISISSGLDFQVSVVGPALWDGEFMSLTGATGLVIITISQQGNENYLPAEETIEFNVIERQTQSITIRDIENKTYGDLPFLWEATASSGLPVDVTVINGPASIQNGLLTLTGAGLVVVSFSQSGSFEYEPAPTQQVEFQVFPRSLTLMADPLEKEYGDLDPILTYTLLGQLVGQDRLSGSLVRNTGENIGEYEILQGTLQAGNNYTLSFTGNKLNIIPRQIGITVENYSKKYGEIDPEFTFSVTTGQLTNNDQFSGNLTRESGEDAGIYSIGLGSLAINENYKLTLLTESHFTIIPQDLIISVGDTIKTYGSQNPQFKLKYEGFVLAQGTEVLENQVIINTEATSNSDVGIYELVPSGASAKNYLITYRTGFLTILKAEASISLSDLVQQQDGQTKQPFVTTDPAGLKYKITYEGMEAAPADKGQYPFTIEITEKNYQGMASGILVIEEALRIEREVTLEIFPNPSQDWIIVKAKTVFPVIIWNSKGEKVMEGKVGESISIHNLKTGLYLVEVMGQFVRLIKK